MHKARHKANVIADFVKIFLRSRSKYMTDVFDIVDKLNTGIDKYVEDLEIWFLGFNGKNLKMEYLRQFLYMDLRFRCFLNFFCRLLREPLIVRGFGSKQTAILGEFYLMPFLEWLVLVKTRRHSIVFTKSRNHDLTPAAKWDAHKPATDNTYNTSYIEVAYEEMFIY
uniref:Uncharacterized protein n=1 Tax=Glossina pallidipes TaxID=7398 RepID=A0A1B0AJ31_GLOPL